MAENKMETDLESKHHIVWTGDTITSDNSPMLLHHLSLAPSSPAPLEDDKCLWSSTPNIHLTVEDGRLHFAELL